jgi:serine/threonine protein kinase
VTEEISSAVFSTAPGRQIAGYQIEKELGRGGMAIVYRARDINLGRIVALKILAPQLASDDSFRQRFIQESRAAAAVDHPHIIPVFEAGKADGELFIAMRYVSTGDVRTLLDTDGQLPVERAATIVAQVASALDAAHAHGLVHRDVKPANMLLAESADGSSDHVYLSDFGLSKQSLAPTGLTAAGQFLGTLDYIAPEQIEGRPVDGRADLYALACATVEMLTGVPPFRRAENVALMYAQLSEPPPLLRERRPELPAAIDVVMGKALAKSPDDRYANCMDFAAALRAACTPQPAPRTIAEPGFGPGRAATELAYPLRADAAPAASAGASSPSGSAPPPASRPPASGPSASGPSAGGPSAGGGQYAAGGPSAGGGQYPAGGPSAAGSSGPAAPAPSPWAAGAASVPPPGNSLPASWFRDAPPAGAPGPAAPSPWSRDAAPSAPSQWPPDPRQAGPRQAGPPSAQMNWPSDPTSALAPASRVGAPGRPGTYPSYQPPRPPRRTGRTVLILLGILIVAVIIGVVVSHLVSKGSTTAPPANLSSSSAPPVSSAPASSAATSSGPVAALTPGQVVQAYYQAINEHQYRTAWNLGGQNRLPRTTYANYVAGFNGTASDVVEILSVSGNVVTAQLTANQTAGPAKVYAGTYDVTDGQITSFDVVQKS